MPVSLVEKTAVVVGASSGIGRAAAAALAREGALVMAAARRAGLLEGLRAELASEGRTIEILPADVTDRAQVERLAAAALERFRRIDLVVYAAGTNIPARAMQVLSPETWDLMLAVNLTGAFHVTQAVLPAMRQSGGLIVYVSSIAAHQPDLSGASYQAGKLGLSGLAHATRLEEKQHGVRVSLVFPGLCRTEMVNRRPAPTPPDVLAQALEPEDVAEAIVALARLDPRAVVPEIEIVPSRL